jgi:hypothetical protein
MPRKLRRRRARFIAESVWEDFAVRGTAESLHRGRADHFADLDAVNIRIIKYGLETGLLMLEPLVSSPEQKLRMATHFALGLMHPRVVEVARLTTDESAHDAAGMIWSGRAQLRASTRDIARLVSLSPWCLLPPQPVDVLPSGRRAGTVPSKA